MCIVPVEAEHDSINHVTEPRTEISSWLQLRHYATGRKVAGSIPDKVIGFFYLPKPSSRTMTLGSTQTLTEMSTKNLPGE
jgi:hypothetical protein